ncbi:MAG: hypothetical protein MJ113_05160 [Lachnospiraceae bacterium]|nr:hypothetical protein [Lachnospiraceae bacterium]
MFRLWAKIFNDNHLVKDMVVENIEDVNRTKKVYDSIDKVCEAFDLPHPIWLEKSIKEFIRYSKVKFRQDNFPEQIDFDYLEIHVIEED